jgi:hypothetical protein
MGTTLTGTKPKDTYDSLIKVTDNGPISGTAKYLSDGLGNDLPIAVSTSKVGIGTSTPFFKLDVDGSVGLSFAGALYLYYIDATNHALIGNDGSGNMTFLTGTSGVTEKVRITTDGYLRLATNGIQFNNDTAAANALDDYEEGTWTMGVAFGGASVGVTYAANTGTYTKIGRQVTVNGYLFLSNKGSSTGSAGITGLPFTIPGNDANYSAASVWFNKVTFANQLISVGITNNTYISLEEVTLLGVGTAITNADFANDSSIIISFTYFV